MAESSSRPRTTLARHAAIFSLATAGSRVAGLAREIVVRALFGVEGPINAFTVAFQIPSLVRALVADVALSSALIPVLSDLLERGDRARAWRVASSVLWLMLLGLSALTALFIVFAPWIMRPFGYTGAEDDLVIGLSRILFPTVALLGVSGVIVGILNTYDHFTVPALAPILWNVTIIAALAVGVPFLETESSQLYLYATAVLVGTVVQVLLPLPWLRGLDDRVRPIIDWRDPAVRRVFKLMIPVTVGIGLLNVNLVIDTFFAARFVDRNLAPASIDAAFRVYMLPQGIFSVAIAAVLFPTMSRLAARVDMAGFHDTVSRGLRQIGFLLIPASVIGAVLAEPIVRVLYERGEFSADETAVVAGAFAAFSAGLTFNGTMLLLNRAFFSLQLAWIATVVAVGDVLLNVALDAALYRLGVWGIPLATSIVNVLGTIALLVLLRDRLGRFETRPVAVTYLRVVVASLVAGGVAVGAWFTIDQGVGRSLIGQIVSVGIALGVGTSAYLVLARLLGIRELNALLSLVRRRR